MCNAFIKKAAIIVHCVIGVRTVFLLLLVVFCLSTMSEHFWPQRSNVIYAIKCLLGSWHHRRPRTVVQTLQSKHNVQMLPFFSPWKRGVYIQSKSLCFKNLLFKGVKKQINTFFFLNVWSVYSSAWMYQWFYGARTVHEDLHTGMYSYQPDGFYESR